MAELLTVQQAARRLGISREATGRKIRQGELLAAETDPTRLDARHVEEYRQARQAEILATLARRGLTPVDLAATVRRTLFPSGPTVYNRGGKALGAVSTEAKQLFGHAALAAACLEGGACRWCKARDYARQLGVPPPQCTEAFTTLFDQAPCEVCATAFYRPLMDALRVKVHGPAQAPPDAPVAAAASPASAKPATSAQAPRTAPARAPRKPKAAKVGRRACGHLVAAECGCPSRQQPVTAAAKPRRTEVHGCGCECEQHRRQS